VKWSNDQAFVTLSMGPAAWLAAVAREKVAPIRAARRLGRNGMGWSPEVWFFLR
jgi:hypothetical protein